jgi:hypothetical protein
MRTLGITISTALIFALAATAPTFAAAAGRSQRAAAAIARSETALAEISGDENAAALGAELTRARLWLDGARAALRDGHARAAERLNVLLDGQIALLRAMLSAARAEARAAAADRAAYALAERIRELEARYDALVLEARGAQLTEAFPERSEAAGAR